MIVQIKNLFSPPVFMKDAEKTRKAKILHVITLSFWFFFAVLEIVLSSFVFEGPDIRSVILLFLLLAVSGVYILIRSKYIWMAGLLLVLVLWLGFTIGFFILGGVRVPEFEIFVLITLVAGLVLGFRIGFAVAGLCVFTAVGLFMAENFGLITFSPVNIPSEDALVFHIFILFATAVMIFLYTAQLSWRDSAVRIEHERAQQYLNIAGIMFVAIDMNGKVSLINKKGCEILGYDEDMIVGMNWFKNFLPKRIRKDVSKVFKSLVRGEVDLVAYYENPVLTRAGEERIISWHNTLLRDDAGHIIGTLSSGEDITEHKQAETLLRNEKEFTDAALDAQMDTFFLFEWDTGKALRWNRAFREISGYSDEEIARMPAPDSYYSHDDLERAKVFLQKVLEEGTGTIELALICKDGREVPTEYRVSVINDDQGMPKYLISVGRDVTERKIAEEILRKSESKYRALFDGINDAVFVHPFKKEGFENFIEVNDVACKRLGYTREELLNLSPKDISAPEDARLRGSRKSRTKLLKDKWMVFEAIHVTKSGEKIPVEISTRVFEMKGQSVNMSLARDITERKRAEDRIRESEERYRLLFNSAMDGVYVHPVYEDGTMGKFIDFNDIACNSLGYTREEMMEMTPYDLNAEDTLEIIPERVEMLQREGHALFEQVHITKEGRKIPVEITARAFDLKGQKMLFSIVRDITEAQKASDALRESEERYRNLVDHSPMAMAVHSDGIIRFVNKEALKLLGASSEEQVLGRKALDFVHPDFKELAIERIKRIYKDGVPLEPAEENFLDLKGKTVDVLTTGIPITFNGQPAVQVVSQDITALKESQKALKESEAQYRNLFDKAGDAIYVYQFDEKGRPGKFIDVNEVGCSRLGYTKKELKKLSIMDISAPEVLDAIPNKIKELKRKEHIRLEHVHLAKDGSRIPVEINVHRFSYKGVSTVLSVSRNITDRKRAEEALLASEARFRGAFEQAGVGIAQFDADEKFERVNQRFCDIVGYTQDEIMNLTTSDLTHPDDLQLSLERIKELRAGEVDNFSIEKRYIRKDGEVVWATANISAIRDESGELRQVIAVVEDITDRKVASEKLQESEEKFRMLIEYSPVGIFLDDAKGNAIFINDRCAELVGVPSEKALNLDWVPFIHPDDRERVTTEWVKSFTSGEEFHLEYRWVHDDGEVVWTRGDIVPVKGSDGEVLVFIGTLVDITEGKLAREKIDEQKQFLTTVVDSLTNPFYVVDANDYTLKLANSAAGIGEFAEKTTCHGIARFNKQPCSDSNNPCPLEIVKETGKPVTVEHVYYDDNANPSFFEIRGYPIFDKDGNVKEVIEYSNEITERKMADNAREALIKELEDKNAELEQFTYTVSHDLKSPLITISSFLAQLEQDAKKKNTERLKDDIKFINDAAENMQRLLDDLLELSRIGRIGNPPEEVALGEMVDEAIGRVSGLLDEKTIRIDIKPRLPVVYVDRSRLVEVFQNLIENAIKFMGKQDIPTVEIGAKDRKHQVTCYVRDNGIGIEKKYHDKIFGLFDKLDSQAEGSGVGLALVRRIVEFNGGKIWVESKGPGTGSTFSFTLPKKEKESGTRNKG